MKLPRFATLKVTKQSLRIGGLMLAVIFATGIFWVGQSAHTAKASGNYTLDLVDQTAWDSWWCTGTTGTCNFSCDASHVGWGCYTETCLNSYQTAPDGSTGNIWVNDYTCDYTGPSCTPSSACAANTCSNATCSDGCGGQVQGSINCSQSCSASNSCGASNTGTITAPNGTCSASAPALPAGYGNSCSSSSNSCGQTNSGVIDCSGSCNASAPADPGYLGQSCTATNACGASNSGTLNCSNTCSASAPALPAQYGAACGVTNACGMIIVTTIGCNGQCNLPAGSNSLCTPCTSGSNICGQTNSGYVGLKGVCSASTPPDSQCSLPDLVPNPLNSGVSANNSSIAPGVNQTYSLTIKNIGTANVPNNPSSFSILLQVSPNQAGTMSTDVKTGTVSGPALAVNSTESISLQYQFAPGDAGTTKYLRLCADKSSSGDAGAILESNENNNCSAWTPFTVTGVASPTCTPSPSAAAPNQSVTWTTTTSLANPNNYSWAVLGGTPSAGAGPSATTFTSSFASGGNYAPVVTVYQFNGPFEEVDCSPVTISGPAYTCGATPAPVISAQPTRGVSGVSSTVSWSATGIPAASTCTVSGPSVGGPGVNSVTLTPDASCNVASGSATITNVTKQSVYTITCPGTAPKTAIVNVIPKFIEF